MDDHCGGFFFYEQAADGYAALGCLTVKSFVRPSHVALMGFAMCGGSVLAALEKELLEQCAISCSGRSAGSSLDRRYTSAQRQWWAL
jgi:dienelactone hydrolase